jgi:hypothetical protein
MSRRNAAVAENISAIVEKIHCGPAWDAHDPIGVVHIPLSPVPNSIPHREGGP